MNVEVDQRNPTQTTAPASSHLGLKLVALLLLIGFLAILVSPLATTDFQFVPTASQTENRNLNPFPEWSWDGKEIDTFPSKFETAFNDHFGFRSALVHAHNLFKAFGLGISPVKDVLLGKEQWLYLQGSVQASRGPKGLSKKEADRWVNVLKTKQAWLASRHIRYMLVVAPNKEEIYPEFLPNAIRQLREQRYIDDILAHLGPDSGVEVLDLREPMLQGKAMGIGLVYDRTDTHWSKLGAYLATNRIIERLQPWFPQLQPTPLTARTLSRQMGNGGDLAIMMGLYREFPEERVTISPSVENAFENSSLRLQMEWPTGSLTEPPMAFESRNPGHNLTLLVTGDSFGSGLMAYLPEHFRRVVRLRPQIPYTSWFQEVIPRLVEAEKPDIYLDVFAGRSLKRAQR